MEIIGRRPDGGYVVMEDGMEFTVPEDPANRHYSFIMEWIEAGNEVPELPDEVTQPPAIILYPADLWRRLTDAEAEVVQQAMDQQPFRVRKIFEAAQYYSSENELWPLLQQMATQLFGEERAAELLAPSGV